MVIFVLVTYWAITHFPLCNNVNIMTTVYTAGSAIIWFSKQENWAFSWSFLRTKAISDYFLNRAVFCSNQHFINCECLILCKIPQTERSISIILNYIFFNAIWEQLTMKLIIIKKKSISQESPVFLSHHFIKVGMPGSLNLYGNSKLNFHSNL